MFKHRLGDEVKDVITGFKGVITGRAEYLTGCRQYSIQPKSKESGEYKGNMWLDEDRLIVIKANAVKLEVRNEGCDSTPPSKG